MGGVAIFDATQGVDLLVSFFERSLGFLLDLGAGAESGQLAVVPTPVAAGRGDWDKGVFAGPMVQVLRQRRNCFGRRCYGHG